MQQSKSARNKATIETREERTENSPEETGDCKESKEQDASSNSSSMNKRGSNTEELAEKRGRILKERSGGYEIKVRQEKSNRRGGAPKG
ncbi:uncharacterized protein DS421_17g576400 [Arachis hypogaea]|nr:uncharacterized protein DS421_17g576400 [Arachis hypogaea]